MAVFRVERNKGYTVMSNHHLRNKELSFGEKVHSLCRLFQIVDFRPLFIALTLRRLDTVLNVDKQRNAALLSGGFRRLCPSARYPFPYGFLCIVCAEGF